MRNIRRILAVAAICLVPVLSWARPADHYRVVNGPDRFYYGHISLVEADGGSLKPFVTNDDGKRQEAVLNLPIVPGDTVSAPSGTRCEILFDTGTVVRLDSGSEIKIETVLAASLSSARDISNLVLVRGSIYIMYREYDRREMLQVLTSSAAVKLKHRSVASIEAADDGSTMTRVRFGKAEVMSVQAGGAQAVKTKAGKGQSLRVLPDGRTESGEFSELSAFEKWNSSINSDYDGSHPEMTPLPKPIQNLPGAVFYFAQKYGNMYGEWIWDDYYGYIWRPFINDYRYPWGDWAPYYCGRWATAGKQMFWVPEEPWGWVPYHLGIWQWDKKLGWVWMPGSMFAPAWVDWEFFMGYAAWRPWSVFDWMYGGSYGFFFNNDYWVYNWPYNDDASTDMGLDPHAVLRRNQLRKTSASVLPVPSELKSVISRVRQGLGKGDERLVASAGKLPGQLIMVEKGKLNAARAREVGLSFEKLKMTPGIPKAASGTVIRQKAGVDPVSEAGRIFMRNENPAAAGGVGNLGKTPVPADRKTDPGRNGPGQRTKAFAGENAPGARLSRIGPSRPDWNPDARIATRLGARIEYQSGRNEIRCPELGISSADRHAGGFGPVLTSRGVVQSDPSGPAGSSPVPGRNGGSTVSSDKSSSDQTRASEKKAAPGTTGSGGSRPKG